MTTGRINQVTIVAGAGFPRGHPVSVAPSKEDRDELDDRGRARGSDPDVKTPAAFAGRGIQRPSNCPH